MKTKIYIFLIFCIACRDEPKIIKPIKADNFNNGFFILCEGTFGAGNASVSFFDKSENKMYNDIYKQNNNLLLGDQAQSFAFFLNKIYIVVQNSQKIEVVDAFDFKKTHTITSDWLESPRYFIGVSENIGYVSDWQSDGVIKVNLKTAKVEQLITTGSDPEQMYVLDNQLFVCNSGYSTLQAQDSTVTVIDIATNQVLRKIIVGKRPEKIVKDSKNLLWISCKGIKKYDINGEIDAKKSQAGSIWTINPATNQAEMKFIFPNPAFTSENMTVSLDRKWLFYTYSGAIYKANIITNAFLSKVIIQKNAYGLGIDSENGNLLVCVEQGYTSKGLIERYVENESGNYTKIDQYTTGILPNSVLQKE